MQIRVGIAILCVALAPLSVCAADAPGVPRFHSVNDRIYRGGQPSREGFVSLARMGVKTVLDLRGGDEHGQDEKRRVEALGMTYMQVPLEALSGPTDEQILTVLAVLDDPSKSPVFIHCSRGADRTGTVVACYRIRHDGWENRKALEEARRHGLSWVQRGMQQYILR